MASKEPQARRTVTVKIEGRAQGVYYRTWTFETAQELGLDGTVRNMTDGSVEPVFSRPEDVVADMLKRCENGPADTHYKNLTFPQEGYRDQPRLNLNAMDRQR